MPYLACITCGALSHESYCPAHRRARKPGRTTPGDPFYKSPAWRKVRMSILARDDRGGYWRCADCSRVLAHSRLVMVDHRLPLKDRPDLALEPSNLRCLCHGCNTRKRARDEWNRDYGSRHGG